MLYGNNIKIRILKSRLLYILVCVLSGVTAIPLLAILGEVLIKGWKQFVFAALGGRNWGVLEIEIIAGREESLLLARPASGVYLSREVLSRLAARGR